MRAVLLVNSTPGIGSVTEEKFSTGATSTRALGSKSVTYEKIHEKSVDLSHISSAVTYLSPSKNLIDKTRFKSRYIHLLYNRR
jgi:hypothetical protein